MHEDRPQPLTRPGPTAGGSVNGWLVAILLIVVAALYLQLNGLLPQPLFDPNARPREVTPRGNLAEDEQATIELFRAVNQSVVHINTSAVMQNFRMNPVEIPQGSGSGFVWDNKGYVVTNYHVIRDARRNGGRVKVVLYNSSTYPADVVGVSQANDLAVLKINAPASVLKPIPVGTSADLQVGQKVFAIGSPFSLDQSLTTGIISGLGREIESDGGEPIKDVIQVNAAINPGNSGGPLLDSAGRLIGVTTAIVTLTGQFSGIGFAIPVDTVNATVPELMRSGDLEPPALGLTLLRDDLTSRLRDHKIVSEQGVLVADVTPGGAAEAAGIRPTRQGPEGGIAWGDLITAIDSKPVHDIKSLARIVASKKVGDVVTLSIVRQGQKMDVQVKLQPRPAAAEPNQ